MRFSTCFPACTLLCILGACSPDTGDSAGSSDSAAPGDTGPCTAAEHIATLPAAIREASGIAASARHEGVLWTHNDSEGTPLLYSLDSNGRLIAEVAVTGAALQSDWESIALGPCPAGDCLYIADIGDNLHERDDRAILRVTEPPPGATRTDPVERFPIRYPSGPEDAEAIFMLPDTSLYIVTKGRRHAVTLYRYPLPLRRDEIVTLVPVQQFSNGLVQLPDMVTGAAASYDGSRIALRTYSVVRLYRFDRDTLAPVWPPAGVDVSALAEPQGEGITFARDGSLLLVTEVGPQRAAATLSRLTCRLD